MLEVEVFNALDELSNMRDDEPKKRATSKKYGDMTINELPLLRNRKAQIMFLYLCDSMYKQGSLTMDDTIPLTLFANNLSLYISCLSKISKGLSIDGEPNKFLTTLTQYENQIKFYFSKYGLTPKDRKALDLKSVGDEDDDEPIQRTGII